MSNGEILIVGSKVKKYIKSRGGLNTSAAVMQALSNKVKEICDSAIQSAKNDKRKTVMEKDIT